jgi:DNA-binding NarL/FixJ family response regulator
MNDSVFKTEKSASVSEGGRIPVWLIDDSEPFSRTASSVLNESPEVECTRIFSRCEPAIEALEKESKPPSVILLDIEMPGMGGLDAIKPLMRLAPDARILMMTAYDDEDYIRKAMSSGASGYLLKSSSGGEFVSAIQSAVHGGMPVHPLVLSRMVKMISQEPAPSPNPELTLREIEILRLIKDGLDDRQIAVKLGMRYNTVLYHTKNIHDKFGVHSRRELIVKALKAHVL